MSINLQITADSPDELFTTLRGLVAGLSTGTAPVAIAAAQAAPVTASATTAAPAKATRTRATKEPEAPVVAEEISTADAEEPTPEPETPASEVVIEQPRIETPEGNGALDFDEDVAPHVLNAVQTKGKAWVMDLLGEFGVGKASELDADRWPELVERLKD